MESFKELCLLELIPRSVLPPVKRLIGTGFLLELGLALAFSFSVLIDELFLVMPIKSIVFPPNSRSLLLVSFFLNWVFEAGGPGDPDAEAVGGIVIDGRVCSEGIRRNE